MKHLLFYCFAFVFLMGCAVKQPTIQGGESSLLSLMTGSFTSAAQAAADTNYYDITLHMVPIWNGGEGDWLYVEQAVTAMPDRPYRQRIYQLEALGTDAYKTTVYEMADPKAAIGKWQTPAFFDDWDRSVLVERPGCSVYLKKKGPNWYEGSTKDQECKSDFNGATFATSIVTVRAGGIDSWDRGFDADGNYLWGAEFGAYQFKK